MKQPPQKKQAESQKSSLVDRNTVRGAAVPKDLKIVSEVGSGGFGSIYQCINTEGKRFALKIIKSEKEGQGIPCLIEASIMATIRHPRVNTALSIESGKDQLAILQEIASSDLKK